MFGLLIVPPAPDVNAAAQALAQALGGTAYDHRQPLLRNLPYVPLWREVAADIQAAAAQLRAAGVPAFAFGRPALDSGPPAFAVRQFSLHAQGLAVANRSGSLQVRWADVGLGLPCRADLGQNVTTITTSKKQSLVKLAMGVPIASKKVEVEQDRSTDHAFFCLLWARLAHPLGTEALLRFEADDLDYAGLGNQMTGSSTANYLALLKQLQAGAGANWDTRLERAGGKIVPIAAPPMSNRSQPVRGTTVQTVATSWDTSSAVEQAGRLLIIAKKLAG